MSQDELVELHDAFMWDCPECGVENFLRAIRYFRNDLSPEDVEDIIEDMELDGIEEFEELFSTGFALVSAPSEVVCKQCKQEFQTLTPDEQNEQDDQDEQI